MIVLASMESSKPCALRKGVSAVFPHGGNALLMELKAQIL